MIKFISKLISLRFQCVNPNQTETTPLVYFDFITL